MSRIYAKKAHDLIASLSPLQVPFQLFVTITFVVNLFNALHLFLPSTFILSVSRCPVYSHIPTFLFVLLLCLLLSMFSVYLIKFFVLYFFQIFLVLPTLPPFYRFDCCNPHLVQKKKARKKRLLDKIKVK